MDIFQFENNASAAISEPVESDATTIFLAPGQGERFPQPSPGYIFRGTISVNSSLLPNEIVTVTARSGDELTVVRAQEGTTAQGWPIGSLFELLATKGLMESFVQVQQAQNAEYSYAVAGGSINAYEYELDPTLESPAIGAQIKLMIPVTNTGPSTLNTVSIRRRDGSPLIGLELTLGDIVTFTWNGQYYYLGGIAPSTDYAVAQGVDEQSAVTPKQLSIALAGFAGANPLSLVAYGARGASFISLPIVSISAYPIRDVIKTPGQDTFSVRFMNAPQDVLSVLTIRVDFGINENTNGIHPVDGDNWPVTAGADPFTYELTTCPYVEDCVFVGGHAYVNKAALIDASPELNRFSLWATANAPYHAFLPLGMMYQKTSVWRIPGHGRIEGHGGLAQLSGLFLSDLADQPSQVSHMIATGSSNSSSFGNVCNLAIEGLALYGNRAHQKHLSGEHAIDLGSDSNTNFLLTSLRMYDMLGFGSAGYWLSGGGGNGKTYIYLDRCTLMGSDNDIIDWKNKINVDDVFQAVGCTFGYHAMATQGTALEPIISGALTDNCITTYAGQTTCTIPYKTLVPNARGGYIVTISGATTVNGVNPNGSWNILAVSSGTSLVTFDTGQVASADGSGGGTGISVVVPIASVGDCIIDNRGFRCYTHGCTWIGYMNNRNGFRGRSGDATGNGVGADGWIASDLSGRDMSKAWIAGTTGAGRSFVALLSKNPIVSNIHYETSGGSAGIQLSDSCVRPNITGGALIGCNIGLVIRSSRATISNLKIVDPKAFGVTIYGGTTSNLQSLAPNPLTAAVGTNVVNCEAENHGLSTGNNVAFAGLVNSNGIYIRPSNTPPRYEITVVDDDNFTFVAEGSALTTLPWGGIKITLIGPTLDNIATGNDLDHVQVLFTETPENAVTSFAIGADENGNHGRCADTKITNCHTDVGDNVTAYEDFGTNTMWAGGNTPFGNDSSPGPGHWLPNNGQFNTVLGVPSLTSASWGPLIGTFTGDPGSPTNTVEFPGLLAYQELQFQGFDIQFDTASTNFTMQLFDEDTQTWITTGYFRFAGNSGGTSGWSIIGSVDANVSAYLRVIVENFNNGLAPYATISGGRPSPSTQGAQTLPGSMTAVGPFSRVRLTSSPGRIVLGTINVFGKQSAS